jgi:rRNA maturation RNase YbeY
MSNSTPLQAGDYTGIHLFNETSSPGPVTIDTAREIVSKIEENEACQFQMVEIIFVEEDKIKAVNREYLQREYVTDIITFSYHEGTSLQHVEGTLYCCAPRIFEQAETYEQTTEKEFKRIIIHGLLHLIGYDDQSEQGRTEMRRREDSYLRQLG